jgi:branched-chain amino acid transport system substrate-binding protein
MQATDLSNRSENLYSMSPSQAPLMTAMINTWKDKGIKSFGMIWSDAPFGQQDADAARKAAEGAGITIASDTGVALDATDFSSAISKTVQANPDAILLAALPNQSGLMANKIRALGYTKPLYGQQGDGNATFFKTAGSAVADGYQLYTFWDPAVADATGQKMLDAYKAAYPTAATPSVFAAIGWDAMQIVAQAIEKAGSVDGAKVLEQFKSGTFTGTILGPSLKFGSDGFVSAKGYLVKYNPDGTKSKIAAF